MAPWFFQSSFFLAWSNQEWMLSNIQFAANVSKSKASRKKAYIWLLCVLVQLYLSASNFLSLHTTVSCFLPPGISQHADNLFIEEDGSCWINWDKSQLRPQQVFDNTTRNYKDLQENCWERLMVRKMQNESDLFDSRNPRFQNKSSLSSFWLHIRYDHYNNHELLKVQASSERRVDVVDVLAVLDFRILCFRPETPAFYLRYLLTKIQDGEDMDVLRSLGRKPLKEKYNWYLQFIEWFSKVLFDMSFYTDIQSRGWFLWLLIDDSKLRLSFRAF